MSQVMDIPTFLDVGEAKAEPRPAPASKARPREEGDREAAEARERLLLGRLQRKDPRAFSELVRRYQDRVYRLLLRMIGSPEEAEDLAQEVFMSVHESVARFRGDSQLGTWIFRIAKNHCLNRLKYLGRRERGRSEELAEAGEQALRDFDCERPDGALESRERRKLLDVALEQLPEEQRLLVLLRDMEGLSYDAISAITEQPEGTIKSRLHRARAALAEIIARIEGQEAGAP